MKVTFVTFSEWFGQGDTVVIATENNTATTRGVAVLMIREPGRQNDVRQLVLICEQQR